MFDFNAGRRADASTVARSTGPALPRRMPHEEHIKAWHISSWALSLREEVDLTKEEFFQVRAWRQWRSRIQP